MAIKFEKKTDEPARGGQAAPAPPARAPVEARPAAADPEQATELPFAKAVRPDKKRKKR